MAELFPYQVEGALWLAKVGRGLLADEPGLGKTAQAIVAAKSSNSPYTLVICPASVVENWKRELNIWWPQCGAWNVISYDRATRDAKTVDWAGSGGGAVILDEAHYLKNPKAKRTQAILGARCNGVGGLIEHAKHVFLLTGTPMPNNPSEMWPWLRAVMPDAIKNEVTGKPLAAHQFTDKFCKTFDNGFGPVITGGKNLAELKARIAPYVLRRKKDQVLKDLPPIRFDVLPLTGKLDMKGLIAQYVEVQKAFAEGGIEALRKIAPHVATLRRLTGMAKTAPVAEWVKDQLDGGMSKIVLFAQHREVVEYLRAYLEKTGPLAIIHGAVSDRQAQVDKFQNDPDCRVFIGQIQAAGTGITLTAASDLVFVESSWVPAENEQAAMRIHRIGQRNACTVRFATIAGSIDEQIAKACARKMEDIRSLFA